MPSSTEKIRSKEHLLSYLDEVLKEGVRPAIHCFLFMLNETSDFPSTVRRARVRGGNVELEELGPNFFELRLGPRESRTVGHVVNLDGQWAFFSVGATSELKNRVSGLARNAYPLLQLAYLPSGSLLRLLDKTRSRYKSLIVTEGTICTEGQTFRNWKRAPVEYSSSALLSMAAREDGKWTSISFKGLAEDGEVFNCRVYERGHLTIYSGSFYPFYSDVLLPYFSQALRHQQSFKGRERKDSEKGPTLHPIVFEFKSPFGKHEMAILESNLVAGYAAAVMHPGNPLLMVQVSDRQDGSSFDVYAFKNRLEIVPHQRATPTSLTELVACVTDLLPTGVPAFS